MTNFLIFFVLFFGCLIPTFPVIDTSHKCLKADVENFVNKDRRTSIACRKILRNSNDSFQSLFHSLMRAVKIGIKIAPWGTVGYLSGTLRSHHTAAVAANGCVLPYGKPY